MFVAGRPEHPGGMETRFEVAGRPEDHAPAPAETTGVGRLLAVVVAAAVAAVLALVAMASVTSRPAWFLAVGLVVFVVVLGAGIVSGHPQAPGAAPSADAPGRVCRRWAGGHRGLHGDGAGAARRPAAGAGPVAASVKVPRRHDDRRLADDPVAPPDQLAELRQRLQAVASAGLGSLLAGDLGHPPGRLGSLPGPGGFGGAVLKGLRQRVVGQVRVPDLQRALAANPAIASR
jgi:hypothetical protein